MKLVGNQPYNNKVKDWSTRGYMITAVRRNLSEAITVACLA